MDGPIAGVGAAVTREQVPWPGSYRLDGPAFVYTDRHSRRAILGYPTQLLAKD